MNKLKKDLQSPQSEGKGPSLLVKKWLSNEDVCCLLGISKRTLQNYRDQRRIPFYQIGRKIYYKVNDVDYFLEMHHIKSYYQKGGAA